MLFTEGLDKPLRVWVKEFRPTTLQDAIMRTWDMKDTVSKKVPTKSFIPRGGKEMKFPDKTWQGKDMMDEETQRERWRKKLCLVVKNHGIQVIDAWERGKYTT
jgi:hypothetical protein